MPTIKLSSGATYEVSNGFALGKLEPEVAAAASLESGLQGGPLRDLESRYLKDLASIQSGAGSCISGDFVAGGLDYFIEDCMTELKDVQSNLSKHVETVFDYLNKASSAAE